MEIRRAGFAFFSVGVIIGGLGLSISSQPPTYAREVRPLLEKHCLSCHGPRKSDRRRLDTYAYAKDRIDDILYRVRLPETHRQFMPYKLRQAPLTPRQIELLEAWRDAGTPER